MSPAEWLGIGALLWAGLQAVFASWRDLGPLTIGLFGGAVLLAQVEQAARWPLGALLVGAAALAAVGWLRAARRRTVRRGPALVALLGAVLAGSMPAWAAPLGVPEQGAHAAALIAVLVGALATVVAVERPARSRRRLWYRTVPVE